MADIVPSESEALEAWAARVAADREQVERFREDEPPKDFYAPAAAMFVADPRRTDDPLLDHLLSLVESTDRWVDIGAGAGRYALPIALKAAEVTAVDVSDGMLTLLREQQAELGIENISIVEGRWPLDPLPSVDVAFIANVGYDIAEIGPFLDAMETAASRLCVAVLLEPTPSARVAPFWPIVHGEERHTLPGLREFLGLLLARGTVPEVRTVPGQPMTFDDPVAALPFLRRMLWVAEGSEKDVKLQAAAKELATSDSGGVRFGSQPEVAAVVSWTSRR